MFSGFTSRCVMPEACAAASAPATCVATSSASGRLKGARVMRSRKVSPAMYSVAMNCAPPASPIS